MTAACAHADANLIDGDVICADCQRPVPTLTLHAQAGVREEVSQMEIANRPRCTAENLGLRCDLEVGHEGDHEATGLWVTGSSSRYRWTNEARELERRVEDANA